MSRSQTIVMRLSSNCFWEEYLSYCCTTLELDTDHVVCASTFPKYSKTINDNIPEPECIYSLALAVLWYPEMKRFSISLCSETILHLPDDVNTRLRQASSLISDPFRLYSHVPFNSLCLRFNVAIHWLPLMSVTMSNVFIRGLLFLWFIYITCCFWSLLFALRRTR